MEKLSLFGTPEYDPEAHGTDVTIKSVPNVPNTDWLEVYYDGQDYSTMPATVDNKTGVSTYDATPNTVGAGGVGFDTVYKAFTFDGTSQYISTTATGISSSAYTLVTWAKILKRSDGTYSLDSIIALGDWVGNGTAIQIGYNTDGSVSANLKGYPSAISVSNILSDDKWFHFAANFTSSGDINLYIDGVLVDTKPGATLNIPSNPPLFLGSRANSSGTIETARLMKGSIANARLFNRALTSDEIYQLYTYQKEYFGHSTNNMTLKAGRLGIGTSEPRVALDVKGLVSSGMPAIFGAVNNVSYTQTTSVEQNISVVQFSQGPNMKRAAGGITFPVAGMYIIQLRTHAWYSGGGSLILSTHMLERYNSAGTLYSKANRGRIMDIASGITGGNADTNHISSWLIQVNAGDYATLTHDTQVGTTRNYQNEWNYISAVCLCTNNESLGGGGGGGY